MFTNENDIIIAEDKNKQPYSKNFIKKTRLRIEKHKRPMLLSVTGTIYLLLLPSIDYTQSCFDSVVIF
jgi:hypothetical protein